MERCRTGINLLKEEVEYDLWTFRWLWLINIGGFAWGVATHIYELVAISGVSAVVSLIGIGRTRRGRRLINRIAATCVPFVTREGRSST